MRYCALVDEPDFPLSRPLALLRRPGLRGPLEHFRQDGTRHLDRRPGLVSGEDLRDLVQITAEQAAALTASWAEVTSS
jgi:hypothetical protein